ncbi:heterogeneous nuclear ribonucleoprotein U-like protein 1 isoform X1 [Palaemon carinicauda]|uniref:heterogeneous nuclear ribonucleoprotein U-like protein 1 isoform X1 n=1 Tax=Palaemon carinicauda TaxID=392227 RepID=UPI0035B65A4B
MDRQYMPYWSSGPGQYPPVKEEPDYSKMGYEDTPGGAGFGIKKDPDAGHDGPPPRSFSANVKVEPPEVKQEFVEPKQEPFEERRGEKRQASSQHGPPDTKRYRPENDEEQTHDKEAVVLDPYNSDLSLVISKENFLSAEPMTSDGFAYVWHGVRATYGFLRGRLFYEVKVEDHLEVPHLENEQHPHVIRCGWSIDDAGLTLGEEPFSYGYGGTAKASTDLKFKDYGRPFGKGDVIGCFLDMDSEPITMSFSVNGRSFGKCYEVSHHSLQGKALFPHILTKNCTFKVNFGSEYPWFEPMVRYTFVGQIPLEERVLGTQGPQTRQDSEVIMMVGLPACGKTTWVEKYCKEHPEKKFYVLGTNFLIDKMKVNGLARKRNYHGRWDVLIDKCTKCLNKLLGMSYSEKRNFIIDQTNVYPSARKRKMKGFPGFYRKAVVIVPDDAEFQRRTEKQISKEGKNVPDSAILEMKANFTLPEVDEEIFDAVDFVELDREEATKLVEQYNQEAQRAGYVKKPVRGGRGGGNFRGGWNRDRNSGNNRGGYNRDNFGNNRDSNSDHSSESSRGGFGRGFGRGGDGSRGGFERGGFGNRGGFNRGDNRGGFGRGAKADLIGVAKAVLTVGVKADLTGVVKADLTEVVKADLTEVVKADLIVVETAVEVTVIEVGLTKVMMMQVVEDSVEVATVPEGDMAVGETAVEEDLVVEVSGTEIAQVVMVWIETLRVSEIIMKAVTKEIMIWVVQEVLVEIAAQVIGTSTEVMIIEEGTGKRTLAETETRLEVLVKIIEVAIVIIQEDSGRAILVVTEIWQEDRIWTGGVEILIEVVAIAAVVVLAEIITVAVTGIATEDLASITVSREVVLAETHSREVRIEISIVVVVIALAQAVLAVATEATAWTETGNLGARAAVFRGTVVTALVVAVEDLAATTA